MRNLLLSAATVLMAGAAFAAPAQSAQLPKGAAHNIVLVHGAFVDQTSWKPVADILTKKGYNVTLVENPLTSLAADVDATKQALAKQNGKTVLVGHSWGGVVITQAGDDPKVSALVYVSAFAPDVGQSLATLAKSGPATEGTAAIHPDEKGNLYIDPKVFPSAVAADLPPKIAESLANSSASVEPHSVRGPGRYGSLARQADVLCDQHEGQGHRTRGPEDVRDQDARPRRRRSPAAMPPSSSMRRKSPRSLKRPRSRSDDTAPGAFVPGAQRLAATKELTYTRHCEAKQSAEFTAGLPRVQTKRQAAPRRPGLRFSASSYAAVGF